ncbi:MAG: DUF1307 domain-containing protein [Acetatifactor sp.]|nr:DUF1307 domain-containing protein [Acetatifactor sp.]MDE7352431.1 DUF1307 domain-containing protein [Acetatifactor sp.]
MKGLKRSISAVLLCCVLVAMLAGCGKKEETVTVRMEQDGGVMEITMDATNDIITKWVQKSTISGVDDAAMEILEPTIKATEDVYAPFEKVEYKTERNGDTLVETITIDMSDSATVKALVEAKLMPVDGNSDRISLKLTVQSFKDQGFTVVE